MEITDPEFENVVARLDLLYEKEMGRAPREIHIDNLGLGRWLTDYITFREKGGEHDWAVRAVEGRIREIAGLPTPGVTPNPNSGAGIKGQLRVDHLGFRDENRSEER